MTWNSIGYFKINARFEFATVCGEKCVRQFDDIDKNNICFQQHSVIRHTAREIIKLLYETSSSRVLSCFGGQIGPIDLNIILHSFLRGYLKVNVKKPKTTHALLHQRNSGTIMKNGHEKFD